MERRAFVKIAYFGYDLFLPCFQTILNAGCEVLQVFLPPLEGFVTSTDRTAALCDERGIPWTQTRVTATALDELAAHGCEVLIRAGQSYRIPIHPALRGIDVHPAPLPTGRGSWPWINTILRGLPWSGVTIHKLTAELDAGDILIQRAYRVAPDATCRDLEAIFVPLAAELLRQVLADFDRFWSIATPQKEGEFWPAPTERDRIIRPGMPFEQVDRIVRAFYGYGCTLLPGGNAKVPILCARALREDPGQEPGTRLDDNHYAIQGGILEIEAELEGSL